MKELRKHAGKFCLIFYLLMLYQITQYCQKGGFKRNLTRLSWWLAGFLIAFAIWFSSRKWIREQLSHKKSILVTELLLMILGTVFFTGKIIYSAIPYHGHLSWVMHDLKSKRTVYLKHDNFFETGVQGILDDINEVQELPQKLYMSDSVDILFDEQGTITDISMSLYGKNDKGKIASYLVDYIKNEENKITIWMEENIEHELEEDFRLEPMLEILERSDYEKILKEWKTEYGENKFGVLYHGKRSFYTSEGLQYVPGDVNGDGKETGVKDFSVLESGGSVTGYEVSLYQPEKEEILPVRYIMEPEYTDEQVLVLEHELEQSACAIKEEKWMVDPDTETMYFFWSDFVGWRLVVADAASGSRWYLMEHTTDGGQNWKIWNEDPFIGNTGVAEGLEFFNEEIGFAGIRNVTGSHSQLFMTENGGRTLIPIVLPEILPEQLPASGKDLGITPEDYQYIEMPEKDGDAYIVKACSQMGEEEGVLFYSQDVGKTWTYYGTVDE